MHKPMPEIEQAIREADQAESAGSVAKRLKIDVGTVYYYRSKIRHSDKEQAAADRPISLKNAAPKKKMERTANAAERAVNLVESIPITLNLTEAGLNAWWAARSAAEKAQIFGSNFILSLEGYVS